MKLSNQQVEVLAELAHDAYVRRLSTPPSGEPARRPWSQLDEVYRQQNRDQVRNQEGWLADIGIAIVDVTDDRPGVSRAEIDELLDKFGQYEHRRWMEHLAFHGWTVGPRDDDRKKHPCFVPWDELSDEDQDKDREPLRDLSEHLASLGLRMVFEAASA